MKKVRWWKKEILACPICDVTWVGKKSDTCWSCTSPRVIPLQKVPNRLIRVNES